MAKHIHIHVHDAPFGVWKADGNEWRYYIDGWQCAMAWPLNGVWFGMGDGGTRKKFKTAEEAKSYAAQVAPANRERIRREHGR